METNRPTRRPPATLDTRINCNIATGHFIDHAPFRRTARKLVQPIPPNAKTEIALFRTTLGSSATDDVKSYDLVWLLHLVGDVHQPLHATSRFDKEQPAGDSGANLVAVCASPCKDELHAFWDDVLGTSSSPANAEKTAAALPAADAKLAAVADEATWINESFQDAQMYVYVAPVGVGAGPYTLNATYKAAAKRVAQQRIALAGARLANLLNTAFK